MTSLVGMLVGAPSQVAFGVSCHCDKGVSVCLTVVRAAGFPVACSTGLEVSGSSMGTDRAC